MAKQIRSLSSFYLISIDKVLNFNDEVKIDDKLAQSLQERGLVDILIEEPVKPKKKTTKPKVKETPIEDKE